MPGHVGRMDIDDCLSALFYLIRNKDFNFDTNKISVFGGSHGGIFKILRSILISGFIAGHLYF